MVCDPHGVIIDEDTWTITLTHDVDARTLYSHLQDRFCETANLDWPPQPLRACSWQEPCECGRAGYLVAQIKHHDGDRFGMKWRFVGVEHITNVEWKD
jgi:hypothetical protein